MSSWYSPVFRFGLPPHDPAQPLAHLPAREQFVLDELARLKLATTNQLARLVCVGLEPETAMRLARRHLGRLVRSGLVRRFVNRSRDRKVGAPGHVYALTAAGLRATETKSGVGARQRKSYKPSEAFIDHRLAISELRVRLAEHGRVHHTSTLDFRAEPDCWRTATGPAGEELRVRPDALARLRIGAIEVSWVVEVDRGTESASVIAAKCQTYLRYESTGALQREHGVFPGVMFIVPTTERAKLLRHVIERLPASDRDLFTIVTTDEAVAVLTRGEDPP